MVEGSGNVVGGHLSPATGEVVASGTHYWKFHRYYLTAVYEIVSRRHSGDHRVSVVIVSYLLLGVGVTLARAVVGVALGWLRRWAWYDGVKRPMELMTSPGGRDWSMLSGAGREEGRGGRGGEAGGCGRLPDGW